MAQRLVDAKEWSRSRKELQHASIAALLKRFTVDCQERAPRSFNCQEVPLFLEILEAKAVALYDWKSPCWHSKCGFKVQDGAVEAPEIHADQVRN